MIIVREQALFFLRQSQYDKASLCFLHAQQKFEESILSLLNYNSFSELASSTRVQIRKVMSVIPFDQSNLTVVRYYLFELLKILPGLAKKHQRTMIATWLVDLLLHELMISTDGVALG